MHVMGGSSFSHVLALRVRLRETSWHRDACIVEYAIMTKVHTDWRVEAFGGWQEDEKTSCCKRLQMTRHREESARRVSKPDCADDCNFFNVPLHTTKREHRI